MAFFGVGLGCRHNNTGSCRLITTRCGCAGRTSNPCYPCRQKSALPLSHWDLLMPTWEFLMQYQWLASLAILVFEFFDCSQWVRLIWPPVVHRSSSLKLRQIWFRWLSTYNRSPSLEDHHCVVAMFIYYAPVVQCLISCLPHAARVPFPNGAPGQTPHRIESTVLIRLPMLLTSLLLGRQTIIKKSNCHWKQTRIWKSLLKGTKIKRKIVTVKWTFFFRFGLGLLTIKLFRSWMKAFFRRNSGKYSVNRRLRISKCFIFISVCFSWRFINQI